MDIREADQLGQESRADRGPVENSTATADRGGLEQPPGTADQPKGGFSCSGPLGGTGLLPPPPQHATPAPPSVSTCW